MISASHTWMCHMYDYVAVEFNHHSQRQIYILKRNTRTYLMQDIVAEELQEVPASCFRPTAILMLLYNIIKRARHKHQNVANAVDQKEGTTTAPAGLYET